jgi:oxygen-independent coproporphyrinogen III oxidase
VLPEHVYVHVPFCARRCSYCDFAIAVRRDTPVDAFVAGIAAEMAARFGPAGEAGAWPVRTLYFGGGTPSRLGGDGVRRLIDTLRRWLTVLPDTEVTLEANPDDVTPDVATAWRDVGVNRLSLGGQSFHENVLRWMHRTHDVGQIGRAVDTVRRAGIENVSLDLIFAVPDALDRVWDADLERALALEPSHLSLYGLTIEDGTPLGRWRDRGEVSEAAEERYADEFVRAHERAGAAGFEHYEVSNFARPGRRSRHNSSYWSGVPYLGVGPAAHGFDGATRRWNESAYPAWLSRVLAGEDPMAGSERLTDDDRAAEAVYLGLRTTDGLDVDGGDLTVVQPWLDAGWGERTGARLRLSAAGWLRLDALAAALTVVRSR